MLAVGKETLTVVKLYKIDNVSDISSNDLPLMKLLHETSSFVPTTMEPLWTFAVDAFAENRYLLLRNCNYLL